MRLVRQYGGGILQGSGKSGQMDRPDRQDPRLRRSAQGTHGVSGQGREGEWGQGVRSSAAETCHERHGERPYRHNIPLRGTERPQAVAHRRVGHHDSAARQHGHARRGILSHGRKHIRTAQQESHLLEHQRILERVLPTPRCTQGKECGDKAIRPGDAESRHTRGNSQLY